MEKTNQLNISRMKDASHVRNYWGVTVEAGTKREDLVRPSFWAHVAQLLKPCDKIDVFTDDGSFTAVMYVISSTRVSAYVRELAFYDLEENKTELPADDYEYRFRGPHAKHSIVRVSDNEVVFEKGLTKQEAINWLENYRKTQAA